MPSSTRSTPSCAGRFPPSRATGRPSSRSRASPSARLPVRLYNRAGSKGWWKLPVNCDTFDGTKDGWISAGLDRTIRPNSFYCPTDAILYLDHAYLTVQLRKDDAAAVMVVAHEMGHHIQHLLQWPEFQRLQQKKFAHFELQADCFAGTTFNYLWSQNLLEQNDLAWAQYVLGTMGSPDSTMWYEPQAHGNASNRKAWFTYGYNTGDPGKCSALFA